MITHRYKSLNEKIMLKRNSINVPCKFGARQKWEPAGRMEIFWTF